MEPARTTRVRQSDAVPNVLTQAMRDLSLRLKTLKEVVKGEPDRYELNAYAQRAELIAADADALVSQSMPGSAYWVEVSGGDEDGLSGASARGGGYKKVTFACSPIEVATLLKERLFRAGEGKPASVILTSATLATRTLKGEEPLEKAETAFAHAMDRLGCDGARTLQLGSPFDYAHQVELWVDRSHEGERGSHGVTQSRGHGQAGARAVHRPRLDEYGDPIPDEVDDSSADAVHQAAALDEAQRVLVRYAGAFRNPLSAPILRHVHDTKGGAFVLFTSFSALNGVARDLAGPLAELGYPMLAQGRDGSRTHILSRFRDDPSSVLLGAASFWQGVDVRGRGLRNVIITKLPFEPPDRPLTQARCEVIEGRGGNPFMEDSLPRAIIRFKQGFGRLVRSKADHGRVVILDPRVLTARYGRMFLSALPAGLTPRVVGG